MKTKWIATNIRFPEDLYMELKLEAAKNRISVAKLVRQKVSQKIVYKDNTKELNNKLKVMDALAKEIDQQNPKIDLSQEVVKMRYEE